MLIEEVMKLVELKPLRQSLVGLPGVNGLSTEQRNCKDSRCCSCTNPKNQGLLIMQIMLQLYQFQESRLADYADHVAAVPIPRIKAC
jgi:hypothetical protein